MRGAQKLETCRRHVYPLHVGLRLGRNRLHVSGKHSDAQPFVALNQEQFMAGFKPIDHRFADAVAFLLAVSAMDGPVRLAIST